MSPAERRAILGDEILAHIDALVEAAPEPSPEVVDHLRRIMTRPAGEIPEPKPAAEARPAADAA